MKCLDFSPVGETCGERYPKLGSAVSQRGTDRLESKKDTAVTRMARSYDMKELEIGGLGKSRFEIPECGEERTNTSVRHHKEE